MTTTPTAIHPPLAQPEEWGEKDVLGVLDHLISTGNDPHLVAGLRIAVAQLRGCGDIAVGMQALDLLEDDLWPYGEQEAT